MSELGPEARAILRAGRSGDEPSPEDRARLKRAVFAAIAAGAATTAASEGATEAATTIKAGIFKSFGATLVKGMAGLLVAGAVGLGAASQMPAPNTPQLAKTVVSFPTIKASAEPVVERAKEALPKATKEAITDLKTSPKAPTSETKAGAAGADTLAAETQRLREVHGALQGGDPQKALALLDEKAEAEGEQLRAERAAARVLALCHLGRIEEANAEASKFLEKNPRSPLAARVRKACPPASKESQTP